MKLLPARSPGADNKGAYTLILFLKRKRRIKVGALGWLDFPEGYYAYTGSAMTNLRDRVGRHLRRDTPRRRHIDYLLPHARIIRVLLYYSPVRTECSIVRKISRLPGARARIHGFGSADCPRGCRSHLVYFPLDPSRP